MNADLRCILRYKKNNTYVFDIMAISYSTLSSAIVGQAISNVKTGKLQITIISELNDLIEKISKMVSGAVKDLEVNRMFD